MKTMIISSLAVALGFVFVMFSPAYGQYLGDKVPPNTMIDETGRYVFPPAYVDFYYSNPNFVKFPVIAGFYHYDVPYRITNGTVSEMSMDCSNVELILNIIPSAKQGLMTLALPRCLIDSKIDSYADDTFFVLLNSKVQHSDIASENLRLLVIPFTDKISQVNIIGVNYPEHIGENACNGKDEYPFSYLLAPLKQFKSGIQFSEIKCDGNLQLTQRYDGTPACVKDGTVFELIKRGWTSEITRLVQSRDVFSDPKDATSSYMDRVTPTLDDFKNILSEPYDIDEIFSKFGEPHDDIGSGIHIYVYKLNDLTEIWIGYVDDVWYVKHVDADGNVLEDLFAKNED